MSRSIVFVFVFGLGLPACTCLLNEVPCGEQAGGCADADSDSDSDTDSDTDTDADTDTGVDCGDDGECAPEVCVDGTCAACDPEDDRPCEDPTPFCVGGACSECGDHDDCEDLDAPRCDGGSCGPCTGDEECTGRGVCFDDLPTSGDDAIAAGSCVECNTTADCAAGACDPWLHICVVARAASQCEACAADEDCTDADAQCVEVSFEDSVVGTYCALGGCSDEGDPDLFCAGNAGRGNWCLATVTRAGEAEGSFCIPNTTTCEAYLAHDLDCTGDADICSADGAGGIDDGVCIDRGGCSKCTYSCGADTNNCPAPRACSGGLCANSGC